jgi:hypothetical protein
MAQRARWTLELHACEARRHLRACERFGKRADREMLILPAQVLSVAEVDGRLRIFRGSLHPCRGSSEDEHRHPRKLSNRLRLKVEQTRQDEQSLQAGRPARHPRAPPSCA